MRRTVIFFLASAFLVGPLGAQNAPREWTSNDGVTITATLLKATESEVVLKLANGQEATVPLSRLSEADVTYLKSLRGSPSSGTVGGIPEESAIDPQVEAEGGPRRFTTSHFVFDADHDVSHGFIAEAALVFEGTLEAVKALPLGIEPTLPKGKEGFEASFLGRAAFEREIAGKVPAPDTVAGVYLPLKKEILVPFTSIGAGMPVASRIVGTTSMTW